MRIAIATLAVVLIAVAAAARDYAAPGEFVVSITDRSWTDASRQNREVPVRIYAPKDNAAKLPIIIFSHGLAGSRKHYVYFGQHMASHGYLCVHVQHRGSDTDTIRSAINARQPPMQALRDSATNLQNAIDRPRDVSFVIDQFTAMNGPAGECAGRLDLDRIAVAGHSFGGFTAMAIAGQGGGRFRDPRVKAAIAMSAPAPKLGNGYADITIPILDMTGTLDDSPLLGGTAESRLHAFGQMRNNERYLAVFTGGDHMVFSGAVGALAAFGLPGMSGDRKLDPQFQMYIKALSLAFLQHTLFHDDKAQQWLTEPKGAKAALGSMATWTVHRSVSAP